MEAAKETAGQLLWEHSAHGAEGTLVRLVVQRAVKQREITPIFEDLGINIMSFETERDPGVTPGKRNLTHFRGSFMLCDDDGERLTDSQLQQLVEALQRVLHVNITTVSSMTSIRKSDSISSNLSVAGSEHLPHPVLTPQFSRLPSLTGSDAVSSPGLPHRPGEGGSTGADGLSQQPHHQRGDSCASHADSEGLLGTFDRPSQSAMQRGGTPGITRHGSAGGPPELHHAGSGSAPPLPGGNGAAGHHHSLSMSHADGHSDTGTGPHTAATSMDGRGAGGLTSYPSHTQEEVLELAAGQQTVDSIMNSPVQCIHQDADLNTAKSLMSQLQVSALLVDTGTTTPGIVTKRDFLKVSFSKTLTRGRVLDIMTQPVISIPLGTSLREAVRLIAVKGVRRVLVHDLSRDASEDFLAQYVGLVSDTDIFRVLGRPVLLRRRGDGLSASPASEQSRQSAAPSLAHYPSNMSSQSGFSMCSLACSLSSLSEQAKAISTEDRYRAAAALWELDFNEIEMTRKIGEGSFGEVVLANFRGTKVAVKRMRGFEISGDDEPQPSPTMMPVFAQFFEREIEIMASIRHPNVVNFIGACHTPPNVALVTEYCARGSLDHLLHKSGLHLDLVKKIEFGMDIARGMSCLHAQRPAIVHRDLKPANLLVSARFEVKVADFGLSRIKDHAQLINSRAGLEGTIEYCAPEVLRGEPYTEKCDIWSCGVVLWELLNRQRPYADADIPIYLLMMALGTGSLSLAPLREEVSSAGLVRLVERCLARQPQDRPSFRDILHALENEYKVVRGKAAAVPRSDSANSVVVLGANNQHGESVVVRPVDSTQQQQPEHPHHHHHHHHVPRPPAVVGQHVPAQVAFAMNAGTRPAGSGLRGAGAAGDGMHHDPHERTSSPATPHAHSRLAQMAFPGSADQSPNQHPQQSAFAASPVGTPGGPGPQGKGRGGGGGHNNRLGRPRSSRMSRARSTPLPAHMWFGDQNEPGWDEGGAEEDGSSGAAAGAPQISRSTDPPTDSSALPLLPPLSNIPEVGAWHEPGAYARSEAIDSLSNARSDSGTGSGIYSALDSSDLTVPPVPAAVEAAADLGLSMDGLTAPPGLQGSSESSSLGKGGAGSGGTGFASPFDGFMPFSDVAQPDTPRINTASSLETLLTDAMAAGPTSPEQTTHTVDYNSSLDSLPPGPQQQPAASPSSPPRPVSLMSSPFSAFAQNDTPFSPGKEEPAEPTEQADLPQQQTEPGGPITITGAPISQAASRANYASSAPAAVNAGKTGSFFSPFANMMSESTIEEGGWDLPGGQESQERVESSALVWGSATTPTPASTSTTSSHGILAPQVWPGLDPVATRSEPVMSLVPGPSHPAPALGIRTSRDRQAASRQLNILCVPEHDEGSEHVLATSMSMSLSMDVPVPTPFEVHMDRLSHGHVSHGQVGHGQALHSPRRTVDGGQDGSCWRQPGGPPGSQPSELWSLPVLTQRSSSSPTTARVFEALSMPLSPLSPCTTPQGVMGRHSTESARPGGSPSSVAVTTSEDLTVHQISWVKV